ncbi:unnamed protein product, partial [marine sediment metagenome]
RSKGRLALSDELEICRQSFIDKALGFNVGN